MNQEKLEYLLHTSKAIVEKHIEETKEKGEDFNIFSVLGMESNETKTHSGMLVALLDPKGNHYQESNFLKLFLEEIGYDYSEENLDLVKVKSEHHLGTITEDYMSGGFIDILISFPSSKAIAIENKIHAGDQPKQMYRYSLYKKGFCELYYLNLFGNEPTSESLNTLTNEDYKIITYRNQIIEWLEKCMQIVTSGSILETSIRQYYILIKQLTHTMENQLEQELNTIIFENLEEAKYIHSHYQKAVESVREKFRITVFKKLKEVLKGKFIVRLGNDTSFTYSQIWIDGIYENRKIVFGVESFSGNGHNHGRIFVGVIDKEAEIILLEEGDESLNHGWQAIRNINTQKGNPLNLSSTNILQRLNNDVSYFNELVDLTVKQTMEFVILYQSYFDNLEKNNVRK